MPSSKMPILTLEEAESMFLREMDEKLELDSTSYMSSEFTDIVLEDYHRTSQMRKESEEIAAQKIRSLYSEDLETEELEIYVVRGDWAVTNLGIYCLDVPYAIYQSQFFELDWIGHMSEKNWVNMYDFLRCLLYARVKQKQNISNKQNKS